MNPKVLIIGAGHSPTGRCRWLHDHLMVAGIPVEYRELEPKIQGKEGRILFIDDFAEMELRMTMAITTGYSHPEMFQLEPPAASS